jgi:hypothetical protein
MTIEKDPISSTFAKSVLLQGIGWVKTPTDKMDHLTDADLAGCVLEATIQGQESLVLDLINHRGPVPIVLDRTDDGADDLRLNGRVIHVPHQDFGRTIKRWSDLKALLRMIKEFGMKGLIEPGPVFPYLWHRVDENPFLSSLPETRFTGELPSLVGGLLSHPELVLALNVEAPYTATPEAYKPVLCWASEEMIRHFPQGLAPLSMVQTVDGHGSLLDWKTKAGEPGSMMYGAIQLGVRPGERCSELVNCLFGAMGPELARLGLEDKQGRVLCETTTDFLMEFPKTECPEDLLRAATEFAVNYCPIEIIAHQAAAACTRDFGLEKTDYHFRKHLTLYLSESFDPLFTALVKDERVGDLLAKEQWALLLKNADVVKTESLVALHKTFGINNSGASVALDAYDLQTLIAGDYRFADGTKVFDRDLDFHSHNRERDLQVEPSVSIPKKLSFIEGTPRDWTDSERFAHVLSVHQGIHKMNLWPIQDVRPADLAHALKMAVRVDIDHVGNNKAMALHAILLNAGVEACAAVASSAAQWMLLTEVFAADELQPYMKIMPGKAKGRLLELGMGM